MDQQNAGGRRAPIAFLIVIPSFLLWLGIWFLGAAISGEPILIAIVLAVVTTAGTLLLAAVILKTMGLRPALVACAILAAASFTTNDHFGNSALTYFVFLALLPCLVAVNYFVRHSEAEFAQGPRLGFQTFWYWLLLASFAGALILGQIQTNVPPHSELHEGAQSWNQDLQGMAGAIEAGAEIDARNPFGETPLHIAVGGENIEIVELLLSSGADPNALNNDRQTPLHLAASRAKSPEILEMLIAAGADVGSEDKHGRTPLHMAACHGDDIRKIIILVGAGADVNANGFGGSTPLWCAVFVDRLDKVQLLLDEGAVVNSESDMLKETPLHVACRGAQPEIVELLLRAGASIDAKDALGRTALHQAVDQRIRNEHLGESEALLARDMKVIEALVAAGANLIAKDKDGKSALDVAIGSYDSPLIPSRLEELMGGY